MNHPSEVAMSEHLADDLLSTTPVVGAVFTIC